MILADQNDTEGNYFTDQILRNFIFLVCRQPLGLESGKILDTQMRANEDSVATGKEGKYARLNNKVSWCIPQIQGASLDVFRDNVYLEIDLSSPMITSVAIQGSEQFGYGKQIRILIHFDGSAFMRTKDVSLQRIFYDIIKRSFLRVSYCVIQSIS